MIGEILISLARCYAEIEKTVKSSKHGRNWSVIDQNSNAKGVKKYVLQEQCQKRSFSWNGEQDVHDSRVRLLTYRSFRGCVKWFRKINRASEGKNAADETDYSSVAVRKSYAKDFLRKEGKSMNKVFAVLTAAATIVGALAKVADALNRDDAPKK